LVDSVKSAVSLALLKKRKKAKSSHPSTTSAEPIEKPTQNKAVEQIETVPTTAAPTEVGA